MTVNTQVGGGLCSNQRQSISCSQNHNHSNFLFAAHPQSHREPCSNAQHYSWGQCCSINTVYTVTLCIDGTVTLCVCLCVRACAPPQLLILSSIAYLDYMCICFIHQSQQQQRSLWQAPISQNALSARCVIWRACPFKIICNGGTT